MAGSGAEVSGPFREPATPIEPKRWKWFTPSLLMVAAGASAIDLGAILCGGQPLRVVGATVIVSGAASIIGAIVLAVVRGEGPKG